MQQGGKKISKFNLFWLDGRMPSEENKEYLKDLVQTFQRINTFTTIDEYKILIKEMMKRGIDSKYILMVSGQLAKEAIQIAQNQEFIVAIVIFCGVVKYHEHYLNEFPGKVKLVHDRYKEIKQFFWKLDNESNMYDTPTQLPQGQKLNPPIAKVLDNKEYMMLNFFFQLIQIKDQEYEFESLGPEFKHWATSYIQNHQELNEGELKNLDKFVNNIPRYFNEPKFLDWVTEDSFLTYMIQDIFTRKSLYDLFKMRIVIYALEKTLDFINEENKQRGRFDLKLYIGSSQNRKEIEKWRQLNSFVLLDNITKATSNIELAKNQAKKLQHQQQPELIIISIGVNEDVQNKPTKIEGVLPDQEFIFYFRSVLKIVETLKQENFILVECQLVNQSIVEASFSDSLKCLNKEYSKITSMNYRLPIFFLAEAQLMHGQFKECVEILDIPNSSPRTNNQKLFLQARSKEKIGDFQKSLELAEKYQKNTKLSHGSQSAEFFKAQNYNYSIQSLLGNPVAEQLGKCIRFAEEIFDSQPKELSEFQYTYAKALWTEKIVNQEKYDLSIQYLKDALNLQKEAQTMNIIQFCNMLLLQTEIQADQKQFEKFKELQQQYSMCLQMFGEDHYICKQLHVMIIYLECKQDNRDQLEKFEQLVEKYQSQNNSSSIFVADTLKKLGQVYLHFQKFQQAKKMFEKVQEIYRNFFQENSLHNKLIRLYIQQSEKNQ